MSEDWGDLERETKNLLSEVRRRDEDEPAPRRKKGRRPPRHGQEVDGPPEGRERRSKRKSGTKTKRRSRDRQRRGSRDARPASADSVGDVMSETISPASGRSERDKEARRERERQRKLAELRRQEAPLKDLSFEQEAGRVNSERDDFVPRSGLTTVDLNNEKRRIDRYDETEEYRRQTKQQQQAEKVKRVRREAHRLAATAIQRRYRGFQGRREVSELRHEPDPHELLLPTIAKPGTPMRRPRSEGGRAMENAARAGLLSRGSDAGSLPPMSARSEPGMRYSGNSGPPSNQFRERPPSQRSMGGMSDVSTLASVRGGKKEIPVELELEQATKGCLFLPDGSATTLLRDTVRNALRVTRWDSVSTLLAHQSLPDPVRREMKTKDAGYSMKPTSRLGQGPQAQMMVGKAKKKNKKSRSGRGGGGSADDGIKGPPLLRNVAHGGYDANTLGEKASRATGARRLAGDEVGDSADMEGLGEQITSGLKNKAGQMICFNCWSSGKGRTCSMHTDKYSKTKVRSGAESELVCSNWDLDSLSRVYRSEDLQELFAKKNSSLRWNNARGKFSTVVEAKHPVYRSLQSVMELCDRKYLLKRRMWNWLQSFIEQIRIGNAYQCQQDNTRPAWTRWARDTHLGERPRYSDACISS